MNQFHQIQISNDDVYLFFNGCHLIIFVVGESFSFFIKQVDLEHSWVFCLILLAWVASLIRPMGYINNDWVNYPGGPTNEVLIICHHWLGMYQSENLTFKMGIHNLISINRLKFHWCLDEVRSSYDSIEFEKGSVVLIVWAPLMQLPANSYYYKHTQIE
jgi:hypothetical protein